MTGTKSRNISNNKSKVIKITFKKDIQTLTLQGFSSVSEIFFISVHKLMNGVLGEEISALMFEFQTYCFLEEQALPLLGNRLWDLFSDTGIC